MRGGQALVVILLILAVALTVGLSVVSRSVTDVGVSTTSEESARALAAAEAGIETALSTAGVVVGTPVNVGQTGKITGSYTILSSDPSGGGDSVTFPEGVKAGDPATVFLVAHTADGQLDTSAGAAKYTGPSFVVCWGENITANTTPALEVMLYYINSSGLALANRNVYDPTAKRTPGAVASLDSPASGCPGDKNYAFKKEINFASALPAGGLSMPASFTPLFLRFKLLYNGDTAYPIGVVGDNDQFPAQARLITAVGQAGQTNRRVEVNERYPDPLPYFDSAVFSGDDLSK